MSAPQSLELQREHLRQRLLMRALQRDHAATLQGWAHVPRRARHDLARGLAAYRGNADATAERALAARCPTLQQLVGTETFALIARRHWHEHPPVRGDLAQWGDALPAAIEADAQLADTPYLADCARLDALAFAAEVAPDATPDLTSLHRLADTDPMHLRLQPAPGAALLASRWPVVTIRAAHAQDEEAADRSIDPFAAARQALNQGQGEHAWVWRQGWQVRVAAITPATACFMDAALLRGVDLGVALTQVAQQFPAPDGFDFSTWLVEALQQGWLVKVISTDPDRSL